MHLVLPQFFIFYSWGLGESLGKASLANTAFGLGRFIPMRDRSSWTLEGWYRYPSEAWPYEALERGLPRPFAKRRKNWGRARENAVVLPPDEPIVFPNRFS